MLSILDLAGLNRFSCRARESRSPGVAVAVVLQRVSDPDLCTVQSLRCGVHVGDLDQEDLVGRTQVQAPPGGDVVAGVRAGAVLPRAVAVPIDGVVSKAKLKE